MEGTDYSTLNGRFPYVVIADCPLDQQYRMNQVLLGMDYLPLYLEFAETVALDQRLPAAKPIVQLQ